MTLDHFNPGGPVILKWDPKNLEIRTMSVEKTLEPLVIQVTSEVELWTKTLDFGETARGGADGFQEK